MLDRWLLRGVLSLLFVGSRGEGGGERQREGVERKRERGGRERRRGEREGREWEGGGVGGGERETETVINVTLRPQIHRDHEDY